MKLTSMLDAENSHIKQWRKHLLALTVVSLNLLTSLLRSEDSPLSLERCGVADWGIFVAFIVLMVLMSLYGLRINKSEQALKLKAGKGMVDSDIRYSGSQLRALLFFAFVGGWVSGALGLGGGSIFNPLMISLGVPPSVSTSTGMYMIMFSSGASTLMYLSYGALNVTFAVWLGFWCSGGIIIGIVMVDYLIKVTGRQSMIVFFLVFMLFLSGVLVISETFTQYSEDDQAKIDYLWAFSSICG